MEKEKRVEDKHTVVPYWYSCQEETQKLKPSFLGF